MDIKPPPKKRTLPQAEAPLAELAPLETVGSPSFTPRKPTVGERKKAFTWILASIGIFLLSFTLSIGAWYNWAIGPASDSTKQVRIVVKSGDTATDIADSLYDHDLIKSRLAFGIYTQLSGARSKLQAGGYVLAPNQTVATIVEHMTSGKTDEFDITIPPGLTLNELRTHFKADGFSDAEITQAFNGEYNQPLLATRPAGATLEGYIYPETYRMSADQKLEELFGRTFDQMYGVLESKGYLAEFSKRNLTIHEGITLASIVQKEVKNPIDQKQVAQVFLKRLADGMQLGSDVTYMYAAEQLGVPGSPSLESPYNTRKYAGLPPGPIANMNPSALEAVAFPAAGDFLYFVAGDGADEGKTFFARTEAEHNANVAAHCNVLCR